MTKVKLNFSVALNDEDFVKVGNNIYTTREAIETQELNIHFIEKPYVDFLKLYEGKLNQKMISEWLLISAALDQVCSYETCWDDNKIIEELIAGREHPVSWYYDHCQKH